MQRRQLLRSLPLLLATACAPPGAPAPDDAAGGLIASVQANAAGDSVTFLLQVTNTSRTPAELTFPSSQEFDFSVERGGRNVWTWSGDRMFAQALRNVTLRAGETRTYEATWRPGPGASGEHVVTGVLTAVEPEIRQSTRFRL